MEPLPLLIYTDAPDHPTGLGRICRDLASRIHADPTLSQLYRVGTLGFFGKGSSRFPWQQYSAASTDDGLIKLQAICEDFGQGQRPILLTITPPTWLFHLALPQYLIGQEWQPEVSAWLQTRPFEHWGYLAIETCGPLDRYPLLTREILRTLDRSLYYSKWGSQLALDSGLTDSARFLHHGIDTQTFLRSTPDTIAETRQKLGMASSDFLVGCVATNSRRKQIPLLLESFYFLRHSMGSARARLWLHTDMAIREYNIPALCADYGLRDPEDVLVTSSNAKRPDSWLANLYSSCDVTCLPTGGEGFGYPCIESLACGTPCVTGTFGAQAEFFRDWRESWLCPPRGQHIITSSNLVEPIYDAQEFSNRLLYAWTEARSTPNLPDQCREHALIWDWSNIWPRWQEWFILGAQELAFKMHAQTGAAIDALEGRILAEFPQLQGGIPDDSSPTQNLQPEAPADQGVAVTD